MLKTILSRVILSSIALSGFSSQAQEPFADEICNDCSTAQIENKAPTSMSNGQIHIIDAYSEVVKQYLAMAESGPGFALSHTSEIPVKNVAKESFEDIIEYITWLNNALSGNGFGAIDYNEIKPYVSSYNIDSAHRLANNPDMKYALQKGLRKYVDTSTPIKFVSLLKDVTTNFVLTRTFATLKPVSTIKFSDGTEYQFNPVRLVLDAATDKVFMEFKLINGSGKDGNNRIPEGNSYAGLQVSGDRELINRYISNAPSNTTIIGNIPTGGSSAGTVTMECDSQGSCAVTSIP